MGHTVEEAVERVIAAMRQNLGEHITIDDMARVAIFSKFHFTRMFQRVTGVSPGRFLSAMRLQEAKRLLVTSSLTIADVSIQVGYNSVGTFSSRFTRSVGLSPTEYRRLGGFARQISAGNGAGSQGRGVVEGRVHVFPFRQPGLIFLGLFPERVPEGRPVSCAVLPQPGPFRLENVPEGDWHLLAHSIVADAQDQVTYPLAQDQTLSVGSNGPITIRRDGTARPIDLRLRPIHSVDPPVLLALLDVRKAGLAAVSLADAMPASHPDSLAA